MDTTIKDQACISSAPSSTSSARDNETCPDKSNPLYILPRWPRYIGIGFHIIVIFSSTSIIALLCHALKIRDSSRFIRFSGLMDAWPHLDLRPSYFILTISALSLVLSIVLSIYLFFHRNRPSFTFIELASTVISVVFTALWITGDVFQHQSVILRWSCRRSSGPSNSLVSYSSVCTSEVSFSI